MKLQAGWTFLGILKNMFFLLLFLQVLPFFVTSIKKNIDHAVNSKTEVGYMAIQGFLADSSWYTKNLEELEKNDSIKGLVLKIESSGGYPATSQAVYKELVRFKTKKPIVVFTENVCASGAYYIAAAGNKIIANPSSLLGSIGAIMRAPNFKDLMEDWKLKSVCVKSGKYKNALDPFSSITNDDLDYLQDVVDDTYNQFVADVALQRGLDQSNHEAWANGRIFTGNQALKLKLVDELGTQRDAAESMAKILGIQASDMKLVSVNKPVQGLMRLLSGEDESVTESHATISQQVASFCVSIYRDIISQLGSSNNTFLE